VWLRASITGVAAATFALHHWATARIKIGPTATLRSGCAAFVMAERTGRERRCLGPAGTVGGSRGTARRAGYGTHDAAGLPSLRAVQTTRHREGGRCG